MATQSVEINATFGHKKPLSVLGDLIAKRQRFLKGETTEMAVTATAINLLRSIRAATMVANPQKSAKRGFSCEARGSYLVGYKREKGSKFARRVIRTGNPGHEFSPGKTVDLAGKYQRGEILNVYFVTFAYHAFKDRVGGAKHSRFCVISRNEAQARAWAERKLQNYIRLYAGTAKWVIGQAQSRVAEKGAADSSQLYRIAKRVGQDALSVECKGDGYSSGSYSVTVSDQLRYAKMAIKGGESAFNTFAMKAANATAGIINKLARLPLDQKIPTPFPEVSKSKSST